MSAPGRWCGFFAGRLPLRAYALRAVKLPSEKQGMNHLELFGEYSIRKFGDTGSFVFFFRLHSFVLSHFHSLEPTSQRCWPQATFFTPLLFTVYYY